MESVMTVSRRRVVLVATLMKRLEAIPDKLNLDATQWGRLCSVMLPEWYRGPGRKGPPTAAQPGTAERIEVYCRRHADGEAIHIPEDWIPTHRTGAKK